MVQRSAAASEPGGCSSTSVRPRPTDIAAHQTAAESQGFVDEATAAACQEVLQSVFGSRQGAARLRSIKRLAEAAGSERHEWPTSLLRRVWEMLMELEAGRRKSPQHEARWLNLLGYALRPEVPTPVISTFVLPPSSRTV